MNMIKSGALAIGILLFTGPAFGAELVHGLQIARSGGCPNGYAARASGWNYWYCVYNNSSTHLEVGTYGDACIVFNGRGGGNGWVSVVSVAEGRSAILSCN